MVSRKTDMTVLAVMIWSTSVAGVSYSDPDLVAEQTILIKSTCHKYDAKCLSLIENEIQSISDIYSQALGEWLPDTDADPYEYGSESLRAKGLDTPLELQLAGDNALPDSQTSGVTTVFSCSGGTYKPICKNTGVRKIYRGFFAAYAGRTYEIQTSDLKALTGESNVPDTVIRVIDESSGTLVAVNDDWTANSFASKVTFSVSEDKFVTFLVHGYMSNNHGTCDISLKENGTTLLSLNDTAFGGWELLSKPVRAGDQIFVGKNTESSDLSFNPSSYADSVLYVFNNSTLSCSSGSCGSYVFNDDDIGTLSRVYSVPWTASAASVVVGADVADAVMNARLFHVRKSGWGTAVCPSTLLYSDCDGDGLSREIESVLGTCDDSSGPSSNCSTTYGRKFAAYAHFVPQDSDSDGASDFAEVYGMQKSCQKTPVSPLWSAGTCSDATMSSTCSYCQKLPLSSMDNPDPTVYDIYVQAAGTSDPYGYISGTVHEHTLGELAIAYLNYTFALEPLECRQSEALISSGACPNDSSLEYHTKLHVFTSSPIPGELLYQRYTVHAASAFFNKYFYSARRYSKIFQFLFSDHFYDRGENVYELSVYPSTRPLMSETANAYYSAESASHEIGHCLGVSLDTDIPNRVSISNYFYGTSGLMARKTGYPSTFGSTCSSDQDCEPGICGPTCHLDDDCSYGACVEGRCTSMIRECAINCGSPAESNSYFARFSRGGEPPLDEAEIFETGHSETLSTNWWCAWGRWALLDQFSSPECGGGVCSIDFDADPDTPASPDEPYAYDFNWNGYYSVLEDTDEWKDIFSDGKSACHTVPPSTNAFLAYGSSFSSAGPIDGSGFGSGSSGSYGITGPSNPPPGSSPDDPGYSLTFGGPGSGQFFAIPASSQISATGLGVSGTYTYRGFSIMMRFKLDSISPSTVSLVGSGHYNVAVVPSGQSTANLVAWVPGGAEIGGVGTYQILAGVWYSLVFVLHSTYYSALLISETGGADADEWEIIDVAYGVQPASNPGSVTIGSDSTHQQTIDGEIAELQIWSHPVCSHWLGFRAIDIGLGEANKICEY